MKNALILHGTSASPGSNWFAWLKKQLESKGYKVWLPQLPGADEPNTQNYNDFLLEGSFDFNEETILVGHSSGAVSILNLLQVLPGDFKVKAAFLVGAFKDDLGWDNLKGLFQNPTDFKKIKSRCVKFIFVHSDNDPHCSLEGAKYLADKLDGELLVQKGQGHFNTAASPDYKQFPFLLDLIKTSVK